MHIRPTGTDPPGARFDPAASRVLPVAKVEDAKSTMPERALADSISPLLKDLSPPDVEKLIRLLEPLPPVSSALLLSTVLRAALDHDLAAVLSAVEEMALLDPQVAQSLPSRPEFESMRREVEQFLSRFTSVGKLGAEEKLAQVARLLEAHSQSKLVGWDTPPETLLRVGHILVEAGGLTNYAKAADVAQIMIDALRFVPFAAGSPENRYRRVKASQQGAWAAIWAALIALAILALALFFSRQIR